MKGIVLVIGACIIILLLGAVLGGITLFRAGEYTEPHNVTTGAGVTTSSFVLVSDLLDDEISNAEITSNLTGDATVPTSYTAATRTLAVGGLLESQSRQLSVTYKYPQLGSYWGADFMARVWPVFIGLGILGLIVAAVIVAARDRS